MKCSGDRRASIFMTEWGTKIGYIVVIQARGAGYINVPKRHTPAPQLHRRHHRNVIQPFERSNAQKQPTLVVGGYLGARLPDKGG